MLILIFVEFLSKKRRQLVASHSYPPLSGAERLAFQPPPSHKSDFHTNRGFQTLNQKKSTSLATMLIKYIKWIMYTKLFYKKESPQLFYKIEYYIQTLNQKSNK